MGFGALQFVPIRAARVNTAKHERNALAQAIGAVDSSKRISKINIQLKDV